MNEETLIYNLTIVAGTDYKVEFDYTDDDEVSVDMSGWSVLSQIREKTEDLTGISFNTSADENGIHLELPKEKTRLLRFAQGVYDVFIEDAAGTRSKLVKGSVTVIPAVTR